MPVISFKVSPAEARALRALARAKQTSVSAYLRERALPRKKRRKNLVLKKHPLSGFTYDATPGPMVTEEDIRTALADFP